MLYKESAIAVMVAMMLVGASIFGAVSTLPAFALHDSDAVQIASEEISQEDDQSMTIDTIEMVAEKSTLRASGTLTVEVIQNNQVLRSASIGTSEIGTSPSELEIELADIEVEGDFAILVEYLGSGLITVNNIDVVQATDTAETPNNGGDNGGNNNDDETEDNGSNEPQPELENIIATKTVSPEDDEGMNVDTVEFAAKKSTLRASGTITVAIVQDNKVLDSVQISTRSISTSLMDMEVSFDTLEVDEDFQVIFMYEGSGYITIKNINVPGTTEPSEEEPNTPPNNPPPAGTTVKLTVNAIDQAGNEVVGMWIEVYKGMSTSGEPIFTGDTPETFELEAGDYIVAVADFENNIFKRWDDSSKDRTRETTLTKDETFTAVYSTDGSQPPQDPQAPPPSAGPGTIVVFAHRIPSEHWGPTFTSASAGMWYVLYNSTGWLVDSGFYDEEGTTITGLNDGETYYVYATDCDECHGDPHDVVFDHWEDMTTENPRAVTTGDSAHAYYRYEPDQ